MDYTSVKRGGADRRRGGNMAKSRAEIYALEADMAFFEARLSLASGAPDTVYQRAQIKTYQTLGALMGEVLANARPPAAGGTTERASA